MATGWAPSAATQGGNISQTQFDSRGETSRRPRGEIRRDDADWFTGVVVGKKKVQVYDHNLGIVNCGNVCDYSGLIGRWGGWRERGARAFPPVPLPSPLAVWIFRADKSDELWQADLSVASGHVAVCASLAGC